MVEFAFKGRTPKTRNNRRQILFSPSALIIASIGVLLFAHPTKEITATQSGPRSRPEAGPTILQEIPYVKAPILRDRRRQSLDLYLPRKTKSKPPLVIFIHGGLWAESEDDYRIGRALAQELVARNVAVALARYRAAPAYRHPAQAEDVAAAVAYLARLAEKHGYDPKRIYLIGHSAGAHLAALVALDPSYLAAHGMKVEVIAGIVGLSGIYDLASAREASARYKSAIEGVFGGEVDRLKAASPVAHARANGPPFLILAATVDAPGHTVDARRFSDALRAHGHERVQQFILSGRDRASIVRLSGVNNQVRDLILAFLKVSPLPRELAQLAQAKRQWLKSPLSTARFWEHKDLIRSYPVDQRFLRRLVSIYGDMRYELLEWPLEHYHAIDLFAYLDRLPKGKVGQGNFVVITNVRNERQVWRRQEIEPYKPVVVVGMDDEQNMFRFSVFYRMLREYSWKPGPQPPVMALPLGAFIHFVEEPPEELRPQSWHYGLTPESFRLEEKDPLAPLSNLPKGVYEALTHRNGCVYCHSFRGVGSRSHHIRVSSGARHGGFALPLESYPPEVWKAFVFNQYEVAAKMGPTPNVVDERFRQALHDLVVRERRK